MVQALREIIELDNYDEVSLKETLSMFRCTNCESEASRDVMHFLTEEAIKMEKAGITRTYLVLNDTEWKKGNIQIDGYFSIALKVLYFAKDIEKDILEAIFDDSTRKNCPAYLIGQLARSEKSSKGSGVQILTTALEYISEASDIVGGRLIYLDCVPDKEQYYKDNGFKILQRKHNSNLIQMYRVL